MPDRFATIITCIDGRIQRPLDNWARQHLAVDYLDVITEPGPDAAVTTTDDNGLANLLRKVEVSRTAHRSTALVVVGHSDCAANPVADDEHHEQLHRAAARLARHLPATRILAVHTGQCGQDCWQPHLIAEITPRPPSATLIDAVSGTMGTPCTMPCDTTRGPDRLLPISAAGQSKWPRPAGRR